MVKRIVETRRNLKEELNIVKISDLELARDLIQDLIDDMADAGLTTIVPDSNDYRMSRYLALPQGFIDLLNTEKYID